MFPVFENVGERSTASSQSTADLLTVESDRTARAFNRSGATQAVVHLIYPRLLTGFGMLVFSANSKVTSVTKLFFAIK